MLPTGCNCTHWFLQQNPCCYSETKGDTLMLRGILIYDMIYLLTKIGLSPGGSITVHIYTQTIRRTTQVTTEQHK